MTDARGTACRHDHTAEAIALARLLGDVYDCATDPSAWPRALEAISAHVRGASSLEWRDRRLGEGAIYEHGGDQKFLRRVIDQASETTPVPEPSSAAFRSRHLQEIGGVSLREEYRPGLGLIRPGAGYRDLIAVDLLQEDTARARLSVARSVIQRQFSGEDRQAIERIAPHVARTIAISHALGLKRLEASRLEAVLDRLPTPIALTDDQAGALFLNASATRLVRTGSVLGVTEGRLHASHARSQETWRKAFPGLSSQEERRPPCASVLLGSGSAAAVAHVLDLETKAGANGLVAPGGKAVFIVSPDQAFATLPAVFASLHGLSTAEARLLAQLAEGGGLGSVAHRLGISVNTAKTHLQQVFLKTGTRRQPELIRRFLSCRYSLGAPAGVADHGRGG